MVLTLKVNKSIDGYIAEIPSLKGCESWAHSEDEAIENLIPLLRFYMSLDVSQEIIIDKSSKSKNSSTYKVNFEKG